ncbi:hypothetical protein NSA47_05690 [Irregularibacter muris]|uniref:Lipoprotein n=1 Tax=Irregularibacter muris TaxID=1796619 RepID=A0AAE3HDM0_9FIRM|nr:hypothetical protein [Irregularibacter muris]MCR1898482.1 hypothetical protein [Irregularibacter muris]
MKRIVVFLFLVCTMLFITLSLVGCTNQAKKHEDNLEVENLQKQIKRYEHKIEKLEEKNHEYEITVKNFEEERDTYQKFIDKAIKYLDKDEFIELAKSEWHYSLEIDEQPVPSDGKIVIDKKDFEILYSERLSISAGLPKEIYTQGDISGEYFEHLKILDIKPKDIRRLDGTVVTAFVYEFENLPGNTDLKLEVSDELKERLGLQTNIINIHIK